MFLKSRTDVTHITQEEIAERAYQLWHAKGCPEGDGQDDWQSAESQLLAEAAQRRRPLLGLLSRLRNRAALA